MLQIKNYLKKKYFMTFWMIKCFQSIILKDLTILMMDRNQLNKNKLKKEQIQRNGQMMTNSLWKKENNPIWKKEESIFLIIRVLARSRAKKEKLEDKKDKIEYVPEENHEIELENYDPEDLAQNLVLAKKMLRKRARDEIMNETYNKFAYNSDDDDLPDWYFYNLGLWRMRKNIILKFFQLQKKKLK